MANSRKTPEESARHAADKLDKQERLASLRVGLAELDLRWLFGGGPSSVAGDMGIRSPLGGQLDAMRLGAVASHGVDVSGSIDRVDEIVEVVRRERCVRARLAQTAVRSQRILRLAFSDTRLPGGMPAVAVMCPTARDAWNSEVRRMAKRWVDGAAKGRAESAEMSRRRAEEAESPFEAIAHLVMHEDLVARRRPEDTEEEARDVSERWMADEGLLSEHLRATGRVDRETLALEAEALTKEALQSFALQRCWSARDDARGNTLRSRRCDRCGHRNEAREREERLAMERVRS